MIFQIFSAKAVLEQALGCEESVTDQLSLAVGISFYAQMKRNRPESMLGKNFSDHIGIQISECN